MHLLYGFVILGCHAGIGLLVPVTYDQRQTGDLNVQLHLKDVTVLALLDSEALDDYTEYDYFYDYADFTVKPSSKPTPSPTTTNSVQVSTAASTPSTHNVNNQNRTESEENVQNITSESVSSEASVNLTNLIESTTKDSSSSISAESTPALNLPQDLPLLNSTENSALLNSLENQKETNTSDTKTRINDKVGNLFEEESTSAAKPQENPSTESLPTAALKPSEGLRKRCKSGYSPNGRGRCRRQNQRRVSLIPFMKLAPQLLETKSFDSKKLN